MSSWDALLKLFKSTDPFLNRLDIYMRIPRTLVMDEIIVDIMVELLQSRSHDQRAQARIIK